MTRAGALLVACLAAPGALGAGGCALDPLDRPPLHAGRIGASIAVLSGGEVAVVDPDAGSVTLLDPDTLEPIATIPTGGEPRALLELTSGTLLVTTYRGGEIVAIDPAARQVVARRPACAGAFGLAEAPDGAFVALSCGWEGSVLRLDPVTLESRPLASGLTRPRAIAVVGGDVWVAELTGGRLVRIPADGAPADAPPAMASLVPTSAAYRPALTTMSASAAAAIAPAGGALHVAHQLVNHTGDAAAEPIAGDYGSVLSTHAKINPCVSAFVPDKEGAYALPGPVTYARFDGGPRVFNAPSAIAPLASGHLLVAHTSSGDVAVLDPSAQSPEARVVASFVVGAGPAGIAVDEARGVAYVDNGFDASVSRIDLRLPFDAASAPRYPADLTRVRPLPPRYSAAALAGRRLFHDATDRHLTPSGVVACSSCHPDGGDDGLVWFVETATIARKRRRTPDLANARAATAPFHWDGEFAAMGDLVRGTVTGLMAGDGLLLDVDAIEAYVEEIVAPPQRAPQDPDAAARGLTIFESSAAGCSGCHAGPDFTDNAIHEVLAPRDPDGILPASNTPGLRGVFLRRPYFHDGRAPDLRDALTRADAASHGGAAGLTPGDLDDLLAYLEAL